MPTLVDPNFATGRLLLVRGTNGFADVGPLQLPTVVVGTVNSAAGAGGGWLNPQVMRVVRGAASALQWSRPGNANFLAAASKVWTVEFFISLDTATYSGATDTSQAVLTLSAAGAAQFKVYVAPKNALTQNQVIGTVSPGQNEFGEFPHDTRAHVAFVANGTHLRRYINGVLDTDSQSLAAQPINWDLITLGHTNNGATSMQAWVEELRVSSIAEYSANFTPPTDLLYGMDMVWPAGCSAWPGGQMTR